MTIRSGLRVVFEGEVPLGGARGPGESLKLDLAAPAAGSQLLPAVLGQGAPPLSIADFFDRNGYSRVAGRAALAPAGGSPDSAAAGAAGAGAAAVVLHDARIPAGSLGADERIGVPVVSVPAQLRARRFDCCAPASRRRSRSVLPRARKPARRRARRLLLGRPGVRRKHEAGGPGSGRGAPDVAPGPRADGEPAFGTVSGSSAAAAVAASGAALLAQARPDLDARGLRGALVGSAATVDGARRLDLGAAAAVEAIAEPASVPLGHANARGWRGTARFTVRNVSERPLGVTVSTGELGEVGGVALAVSPGRFRLAPREKRKVSIVARLAYVPPACS